MVIVFDCSMLKFKTKHFYTKESTTRKKKSSFSLAAKIIGLHGNMSRFFKPKIASVALNTFLNTMHTVVTGVTLEQRKIINGWTCKCAFCSTNMLDATVILKACWLSQSWVLSNSNFKQRLAGKYIKLTVNMHPEEVTASSYNFFFSFIKNTWLAPP